MKNIYRLLLLVLALCIAVSSIVSCDLIGGSTGDGNNGGDQGGELAPFVDYVADVKLDKASGRLYTEAKVKTFVDGDTTHFDVDKSVSSTGVLKARYLAIDTPESTGQIEPWGKKAAAYTKTILSSATSIILESDTSRWDLDSTGDRYLVWVWYKTDDMADYRNLNLEILQEGLSKAKNSSDNSYGETAVKIIAQALAYKLHVHSKDKDPDFYYGAAKPITLKELKLNIDDYVNTSVSFEGVVVKNAEQTAYVEEYDEETGTYFGIQVYYGFGLDSFGLKILNVGNRVRITGSVQYYETGGTYQISDIKYNAMIPNHEDNILNLGEGYAPSYHEVDVLTLLSGKLTYDVTATDDDGNETTESKTFDYGYIGMHGSASLKGLTIKEVYTTTKEGSSKGAMSITCVDADGNEVVLRTVVLMNSDGSIVTADAFPVGSVVNAKGIIDCYEGEYQLKIFSAKDIEFVD